MKSRHVGGRAGELAPVGRHRSARRRTDTSAGPSGVPVNVMRRLVALADPGEQGVVEQREQSRSEPALVAELWKVTSGRLAAAIVFNSVRGELPAAGLVAVELRRLGRGDELHVRESLHEADVVLEDLEGVFGSPRASSSAAASTARAAGWPRRGS